MPILTANKITKTINNMSILKETSISISEGSIHVIEGKSGSGKSTLLSLLGGMDRPTTGEILFDRKNIYKMSDTQQSLLRGKEFGFVFQAFNLFPELTARQNIHLPLKIRKKNKRNVNIIELANDLGIQNILDKKVMYLSGGEQQRVAIGRAIIISPSIIFADEPTGNLDYKTSEAVVELLLRLNKMRNISLVIVTHQKELVKVPHYKYFMQNGKLKLLENPDV